MSVTLCDIDVSRIDLLSDKNLKISRDRCMDRLRFAMKRCDIHAMELCCNTLDALYLEGLRRDSKIK